MKRKIMNEKEFDAIMSLIDLAEQNIFDAEDDHMKYKNTTRRNGGYSSDVRVSRKALAKLRKVVYGL